MSLDVSGSGQNGPVGGAVGSSCEAGRRNESVLLPVVDTVLEALSSEEFALQELKKWVKVHLHDGIWWVMAETCFCMPVWVYTPLPPGSARPGFLPGLGGYLHVVPPASPANGMIDRYVIDPLPEYNIGRLDSRKRQGIRAGLKKLAIRRIEHLEEFAPGAHAVYLAWRNGKADQGEDVRFLDLCSKQDLKEQAVFRRWITREYGYPKRLTLGAYLDERLVAFIYGYGVEDTALAHTMCSDPAYGRLHATDALTYAFADVCRRSGFERLVNGRRSSRPELDVFKKRHGYKEVEFPCNVRLNSCIKPFVRLFCREKYDRLLGRKVGEGFSCLEGTT